MVENILSDQLYKSTSFLYSIFHMHYSENETEKYCKPHKQNILCYLSIILTQ